MQLPVVWTPRLHDESGGPNLHHWHSTGFVLATFYVTITPPFMDTRRRLSRLAQRRGHPVLQVEVCFEHWCRVLISPLFSLRVEQPLRIRSDGVHHHRHSW